jgi:hypothetical protein
MTFLSPHTQILTILLTSDCLSAIYLSRELAGC